MNTYFMQKPRLFAASLGAMALALLPSCQDEDFGYTADEIRLDAYNRNFKEVFGEVDPDHNWSMAQNVKVNLNVPGANGYQVRILTEAPTNRTSTILYDGIMSSNMLSAEVDVIRGTRMVYVELKSQMGTRLVDGYYTIGEDGIVDVNKMGTRAFSPTAPGCGVYHALIQRYNRYWDVSKSVPSDADYTYDYGWSNNQYSEYLIDGNKTGKVPAGWTIHCLAGDRIDDGTDYSNAGGPRVLALTGSGVQIDGVNRQLTHCLYFRNEKNNDTQVECTDGYVEYGDPTRGKQISVPGGRTLIHIPLSLRAMGSDVVFKINFYRRNDIWDGSIDWINEVEKNVTVEQTYNSDDEISVNFKDVVLDINNLNGGEYKLKVQIVTTGWIQARCGGFFIESKTNTPVVVEDVWGYLDYKDVRGGGIDRWNPSNKVLFGNETKRPWWGGVHTFAYRTFDVRQMVNAENKTDVSNGTIGQFYIIDGENGENIKVETEPVKYADMFPLYGMYKSTTTGQWKGSPFREGDNHVDPFFSDGNHKATDFEMPKSAQIVTLGNVTDANGATHDGSVSIKMVGIGTGWLNDVGYFYYKADDESVYDVIDGVKVLDMNKVPKVVIRKNMQSALTGDQPNASNIDDDGSMAHWGLHFTNYDRYVDGCYALSLSDGERSDLMSNLSDDAKNFVNALKDNPAKKAIAIDATFDAPIYKLPYYTTTKNQWDGVIPDAGTATYIWPKGYVIGFFGIRTGAELACELARVYTSDANVQRYYFNDIPRGATFSYKGKNYIGLEDELDYDNNDFLYEIEGVEPIEPDITPQDDPVQVNEYQRWVVACEDLGGVWDYDFNDLVWDITKEMVYEQANARASKVLKGINIYFTPLAAGGTLEAVVQYNYNNYGEDWRDLGEIHNLVKRTREKENNEYKTPTNEQLNVDPGHNPTLQEIGERIQLGETIDPSLDGAVTIGNILNHFRVVVENHDGEKYIVGNNMQSSPDHNHDTHNTGNEKTNAPQFLLLPCGWAWPAEAVCITDVYSKISEWATAKEQTEWYWGWRNSTEGKTGAYIQNPLW